MADHVLVVGNPFDGMQVFGPVTPNDPDLEEYIEREHHDDYWWLVTLGKIPVEPIPLDVQDEIDAGLRERFGPEVAPRTTHEPRTPDVILADVYKYGRGEVELGTPELPELIWEILEDVRSAYRIAINAELQGQEMDADDALAHGLTPQRHTRDQIIKGVDDTIMDYLTNNYGDD